MIRYFGRDMKNNIPKLCINCKHFLPDEVLWPDEKPDNGKCKLFGNTNLVNGKTKYDYAYSVRNDNNLCGEIGILFTKNEDA